MYLIFTDYSLDYVQEIYNTFVNAHANNELDDAVKLLKDITPMAMNSMLIKQPREEAIVKRRERKAMVVMDVPPTVPG